MWCYKQISVRFLGLDYQGGAKILYPALLLKTIRRKIIFKFYRNLALIIFTAVDFETYAF
jgi:hypothetical protein